MADEKRPDLLRFETSISMEQLLALLPQIAARTGLQIDRVINPTIHIHIGEAAMDVTKKTGGSTSVTVGNVTDSTVGAIGTAKDIFVFSNHIDASGLSEELKRELKHARYRLDTLALEQEDKDDVADDLARLTEELQKPEAERQEGRLKRYFLRIREIAPVIASGLSITASMLKITGH